jgi:hypothetical protein
MTGPSYLLWQTGVIWQITPRSFKDAIGNGAGDLRDNEGAVIDLTRL